MDGRKERYELEPGLSESAALVTAFMLVAAALVHLAVTPSHFAQWWAFGAFFALAALVQVAQAVQLLRRPSSRLIAWICAANAAIVVVWVLSRTSGLPVGPESGRPEAVGWLDVLTTYDEAVLIAILAIELGWLGLRRAGRLTVACQGIGTLMAVLLTLAFAGGVGGHGHS